MMLRAWREGLLPLACAAASLSASFLVCGCGHDDDGGDRKPEPEPTELTGALEIAITPESRTFVELATPALTVLSRPRESIAWDLAFQGLEVFTNGGVSGPGRGSAFGPLSAPTFLSDTAPDVPLERVDRAGGAFIDWYDYDGPSHRLFSRFHVYGLRDGAHLYKVQVLSYYGERAGAPVSATYRLRYAEVKEDALVEPREISDLDAAAGGLEATAGKSTCVELSSGKTLALTVDEERERSDWHLCFRRDAIAVNGGVAGPRGVQAVDLQASETSSETAEAVQARTPASELERFDDVSFETLSDPELGFRTDGVVTAFSDRWLEPGRHPPVPASSVWLVIAADGASKYLLAFDSLEGDPMSESATLELRIKSVR